MLKVFILALLTLLGVVYITLLAKEDPGYALLSYGDWSVEMTIILLVVVIGTLVIGVITAFYLLFKFLDIPGKLSNWNDQRRVNSAISHSIKGFLQITEGKWKSAEKHLNNNIDNNKLALLNYLAVARVAQQLGENQRRDDYLMKAFKCYPKEEIVIGLTQAELELDAKQYRKALITLQHLKSLSPKHKRVLHLLMQVYKQLNLWGELDDSLKLLKSQQVLKPSDLYALEKEIYQHVLQNLANAKKKKEIISYWNKLSRNLKNDVNMCCSYSELLIELEEHEEASKVLKNVLKREWNTQAISIYSNINESSSSEQLSFAESLLENHEDSPVLLFTLGKICIRNELWGKARDYIQESITLDANSDKYYALGNLYENQLDDKTKALECYREGLLISEPAKIKDLSTQYNAAKDYITA